MCGCINKGGKAGIFNYLRPQLLEPSELHGKVAQGYGGGVLRGWVTFSLARHSKGFDFCMKFKEMQLRIYKQGYRMNHSGCRLKKGLKRVCVHSIQLD